MTSDTRLEALIRIAADAAKVVLEVYQQPFKVDYKGPADPVTDADRRANALICERLAREFPGIPIVAEESAPETFAGYERSSEIFFVDPVDGTNEFIERNAQFVVMIGLVEGSRATTAVMNAPAQGMAWAGAVGKGAFSIALDGTRAPIHVSDTREVGQACLVSSRSHRSARLDLALEALGVREIVRVGSAGLKGVEVARGGVDAYVAPHYAGKRWDVCAAEALVASAGGRVTDAYGNDVDYRAPSLSNDRGVITSNGFVHDALLEKLTAYRASQGN
ncbi:MAG TPA: inositol monophosphatase family protein [Polyangiaceae bacterium]